MCQLVLGDSCHSLHPGEMYPTNHAHPDHTKTEGMSHFCKYIARLAHHLRLTVGCFSLFWGQDQKCQYSLLQEEKWKWYIAEEQSHRIFTVSKTSLENLPRSSLEILISSIFCKYVAKGLHSFVYTGLMARTQTAGKSALLSRRSLGTAITKSHNKHKNWKHFSQLLDSGKLEFKSWLPHLPVKSFEGKLITLATGTENLFSFRLCVLPTPCCLILR